MLLLVDILDTSIPPILRSDSCIDLSGDYTDDGASFDPTTLIGPYSTPVIANPRVIVHLADGEPLELPVGADLTTTPCSPIELTITIEMDDQ